MNTISIEGDALLIVPRGLDKLWGFRRRIRVPLRHVRGATADTGVAAEPRGVRAPGLGLPGRTVGTFHGDGERTYWNVRDGSRNVVIDFRDEHFARAVLTVEDPMATERLVDAAIR